MCRRETIGNEYVPPSNIRRKYGDDSGLKVTWLRNVTR